MICLRASSEGVSRSGTLRTRKLRSPLPPFFSENPQPWKMISLKPGVGQNTYSFVCFARCQDSFLVAAFLVHLPSFFSCSLPLYSDFSHGQWGRLLFVLCLLVFHLDMTFAVDWAFKYTKSGRFLVGEGGVCRTWLKFACGYFYSNFFVKQSAVDNERMKSCGSVWFTRWSNYYTVCCTKWIDLLPLSYASR